MRPSPITDIKAFVPAKDLDVSKAFYANLGFTINWSNDGIAAQQISCFGFRLQKFFVARHAGNFMMGPRVEDADAWRSSSRKSSFPKSAPVQGACDATLGPANTET